MRGPFFIFENYSIMNTFVVLVSFASVYIFASVATYALRSDTICNIIKIMKTETSHKKIPEFFRPILWSLKWDVLDVEKDKEDIIVGAVNEGNLRHWRWIIETYGKPEIRRVLAHRLETEFHPESRNLAKIIFSVPKFRHARESVH